MSIVSCPSCREKVTVPADTEPDALVRCPLCQGEYALQEALSQLPPSLEVIAAPPSEASGAPLIDFGGGDSSAIVAEAGDKGIPAFRLDQPGFDRAFRAPRPRRKKSAVKEVLKVVAGGVVGLAIGQLILWWGFERDPFGLGPKVGDYASWAVPATYHATMKVPPPLIDGLADTETEFEFTEPPENEPYQVATKPKRRRPQKDRQKNGTVAIDETNGFDKRLDDQESGRAPTAAHSSDTDASDTDASAGAAALTESATDSSATEFAVPEIAIPEIDLPSRSDAGDDEEAGDEIDPDEQATESSDAEATREPVTVRGLPALNVTDLVDRLAAAKAASQAWDEAGTMDAAQMRTMAARFYRSLALLGEVLTVVDQADPQVREYRAQAYDLLLEIATNSEKSRLVQKVSPSWLAAKRPHNGVLLIGKVKSIEEQGALYATKLRIGNDHDVIVVSGRDPRQTMQPDARAILLGLILESPKENLQGYSGSAATVVLDGFHAVPPLE